MCSGGSSFNQLAFLRDDLEINDGLVLVNGQISFAWQNAMFWRTLLALCLHIFMMISVQALSLKLGFFSNRGVTLHIEDIVERPTDETITAYSFIKQPFFHKAFAINAYEKGKAERRNRRYFFC